MDKPITNMSDTLDLMESIGGSFIRSLAACYMSADPQNKARLLAAFPDWFGKYSKQATIGASK